MDSATGSVPPENRVISPPMPEPAEFLVTLESRLAQRLLKFERLDEAWPKGLRRSPPGEVSWSPVRGKNRRSAVLCD